MKYHDNKKMLKNLAIDMEIYYLAKKNISTSNMKFLKKLKKIRQ